MTAHRPKIAALVISVMTAVSATPASAQWLKGAIKDAAKDVARHQVDRAVRGAIRCAIGQIECIEQAKKDGKEVVYVDDDGKIITDDQGNPVMDEANLPAQYKRPEAPAAASAPPAVVSSTYDFEPGDRVILYEDYAADVPGDFPRNLQLVNGNWDIVDFGGQRVLRNTGPRHSAVKVPLPETLPEQFTIEIPVLVTHGTMAVSTSVPEKGQRVFHLDGHYFQVGMVGGWGFGLTGRGEALPEVINKVDDPGLKEQMLPIRIMADGEHVKMFVGEQRVANVPQAKFKRSDTLWLENTYHASQDDPILIGAIRVAGGGRDLYDALAADGRVAVHDILFDTDEATIKPESTEVLNRIGSMLSEHPEMSLMIEGHTDSTGDFDHNMDLSQRRAESVKQWLVANHGIADTRLRSIGLGSTQPKDTNDSEEGKRQNRRVELVKIGS